MPTTVDRPEDLLDLAKSLARGRKQTLSRVIAPFIKPRAAAAVHSDAAELVPAS